jgi:hypothetical protein
MMMLDRQHVTAEQEPRSLPGLVSRLILVALLVAGSAFIGTLVVDRLPADESEPVPVAVGAFEPITFPKEAVDGVLLVEIPLGAYDAFAHDRAGYIVPPAIRLQAGDRIEIVNHDTGPHMIFYAFVPPGSTSTLRFDTPGIFTYSSGCAVNPAMNSFTSVIVS